MLQAHLTPVRDARHLIVQQFRRRIEGSASGFPISPTPVCPRLEPEETSRAANPRHDFVQSYAFNVRELRSSWDEHVVI